MGFEIHTKKGEANNEHTEAKILVRPTCSARLNKRASDMLGRNAGYAVYKVDEAGERLLIQPVPERTENSYKLSHKNAGTRLSVGSVLRDNFGVNPRDWGESRSASVTERKNGLVVHVGELR